MTILNFKRFFLLKDSKKTYMRTNRVASIVLGCLLDVNILFSFPSPVSSDFDVGHTDTSRAKFKKVIC